MPAETQDVRASRLGREIEAASRNHELLRAAAVKVTTNNTRLRAAVEKLIEDVGYDLDMAIVIEKLEDALSIPQRYYRDQPAEIDQGEPDDDSSAASLENRLRLLGRTCYLMQEASAPIVWNSDAIRNVVRELIEEINPEMDEDDPDIGPLTMDQAAMAAIADQLDHILKSTADK